MRILLSVLAAAAAFSSAAQAALITSFTGIDVTVDVTTTSDGGGGFSATLLGSNMATIGAGAEFSIYIYGPGLYSPSDGVVDIDFLDDGTIVAVAQTQFAVGNTSISNFSFDISISFADPAVLALTAVAAGDLARGDASVSGLDPIVWSFFNEHDNSYGEVMTFNDASGSPLPSIIFTAEEMSVSPSEVPLPAALPMFMAGLGLCGAVARRRRKLKK